MRKLDETRKMLMYILMRMNTSLNLLIQLSFSNYNLKFETRSINNKQGITTIEKFNGIEKNTFIASLFEILNIINSVKLTSLRLILI